MRYQGNFAENIINASRSNDKRLAKEIVLDETSRLIQDRPESIIKALTESDVSVQANASTASLINKVSYNIVNNSIFQKNLEVAIAENQNVSLPNRGGYSNLGVDVKDMTVAGAEAATSGGAVQDAAGKVGGGAATGGVVGAIAGAVGSIFDFATSQTELKSEEEQAKAMMYAKIFGEEKKTNWMPIIIIGGVLLVGGLVAWRVLAKKGN